MGKKVLITLVDPSSNNAGPKARTDVEYFLKQEGFECWKLKYDVSHNLSGRLKKLKYINFDIPHLFNKKKIDEIIIQYPLYSNALMDTFIKNIRKYTNAKLVVMIHDIESLRFYKDDVEYLTKEKKWLSQVDGIIAHNDKMIEWIRKQGITTPTVPLGIFDYQNPQPLQNNVTYKKTVSYAGNLRKSVFLEKIQLQRGSQLDVFGPNPRHYSKKVNYCGQYTPEELPLHLQENFGLVWDGKSLESCDGTTGNYLKYNCPHKASLYLSTGIPVIIWKSAALADLIEKGKIGITVDNLEDLSAILERVTPEKYVEIKKNTLEFAEKLRSGKQIKTAVNKIETELN